jgi:hypothetical protein
MRTIEEIKRYFGPKFTSNYEAFIVKMKPEKWQKMLVELGDVSQIPGFNENFKIKVESTDHYYSLVMHHPQMIAPITKRSFPFLKNILRAMIADPMLTEEYNESRKTYNEFIRFIDSM